MRNILACLTTLILAGTFVFVCPKKSYSQETVKKFFKDVKLYIDTNTFSWSEDRFNHRDEEYLSFIYNTNNPIVEFRFHKKEDVKEEGFNFNVVQSSEYSLVDSVRLIDNSYYKFKLRFEDISSAEFLALYFIAGREENAPKSVLPLFPYTETYATVYPGEGDLFIGEEKKFEVVTNNQENLKIDERWVKEDNYEYRLREESGKVILSIIPGKRGELNVSIPFQLKKPLIDSLSGKPTYQLSPFEHSFSVKGSRLSFLRFDEREVIWNKNNVEGVELQIDNHRLLEMNKTYRIEATDEPGGALYAEIFTIRRLSNDKMLCMFRPYNYHKTSDSYLFIKDGDQPKFITNINILPESKIRKVSLLREGGSWVNSTNIYPGETVEIRLEGDNMTRGEFIFEDLQDVSTDTVVRSESVVHYVVKVPSNIRKKSINIYNRDKKTGVSLDIKEHLEPRKFDFIVVEYGGNPQVVSRVSQPLLHNGTIGDVSIQFDDYFIDEEKHLYGKQFLEIEVTLKDSRNNLIERLVIDDIEVCPGESSPRYFSYNSSGRGCLNEAIFINDHLSNKTHGLEHWSKIELVIRHRKDFYDGKGYSERIEIVKEKSVTFDVDLSFPAGLIIKKVGVEGFPGLSGVSVSMLGQFSFYQKGEIQRLRPYKVGAGFLAKNAFNFNPEADRDLGIVVLGSVYPTKKGSKFSFPLYAGFGYFLNEERFFYLIGPGITVNL